MGEHYRTWRRQLTEIQERFMEYDGNLDNYGDHSDEAYAEYKKNRKPFEDEIEAHYAKMGAALEADGL